MPLRRERLAENIMHFARVLRAAGLPVGPAKVIAALDAVEAVGVEHREDFRAALQAVFIERHEQQALFEQAFELFWRNPRLLERMLQLLLPRVYGRVVPHDAEAPLPARLAEALAPPKTDRDTVEGRSGDRARRRVDVLAARSAAGQGFRVDERRRAGAGQGDDRAARPAAPRTADAAHRRRAARLDGRPARDASRHGLGARGGDAAGVAPAAPPSAAAGRAVRHLRLDGPLFAHAALFPARDHQRSRSRARRSCSARGSPTSPAI